MTLLPTESASAIGLALPDEGADTPRWERMSAQLEIWIPAGFLALMLLACFVWPLVFPLPNPVRGSLAHPRLPPLSPGHMLGTDPLGNDIVSRILYGGRVSFEVGLGTTAIGILVGGSIGGIAGYLGRAADVVIMRTLDVLLAFPSLVLAIVIATYLGPSEVNVIWAISFFAIPAFARLSRAGTLRLREEPFVLVAKLSGTSVRRILFRHITPNVLPTLVTYGLLGVGVAITVEAALSYLGLGVPPPGPSWGNMIATGQQNLTTSPYLVIIPSGFLFATVLSLNLLGDALRARWAVV